MIEIQQFKYLIAISEYGTISKAAEELFLSQPTLSRSMQKLEDELGVTLFLRNKNKVVLNENGLVAVEYAKKLLGEFENCIELIRTADSNRNTISVGACAPAPLWLLLPQLSTAFPEKKVSSEIKEDSQLVSGLKNGDYQIVIISDEVNSPECISKEFCKEQLYLCVRSDHKLSQKEFVTYADFEGLSMLLFRDIGSWSKICDHLPNTRFIVQNDQPTFSDLITESHLPFFATDITTKLFGTPNDRTIIPIHEQYATATFHISVLKANKDLLPRLY